MNSLRSKLMMALAVLLLFIIGQAAVSYYFVTSSERLVVTAIDADFSASADVGRILNAAQKIRRFEKEYFIYLGDPAKRATYHKEWQDSYNRLKQMLETLEKNATRAWMPADLTEASGWQDALGSYGVGFDKVVADVEAGRVASVVQANEGIREAKDRFRVLLDGAAKVGDIRQKHARESRQTISGNFTTLNLILGVLAVAGMTMAGVLLVFMPRAIAKPIASLSQAAHRMSTGDLEHPVAATGIAEFRELSDALERSRISQKTMMERLRAAAAVKRAS